MKELLWVVGADGMLGSALCKYLQKQNRAFITTSKEIVDICDEYQVDKFSYDKAFTHIFNCAAYTQVDQAEKKKERAHAVNVLGAKNLAKIAKAKQCRFIQFSTDYVFDGEKERAYVEEDIPHPCNTYGKTKYEGEMAIFLEYPSSCVIRTSWLVGENRENFVTKILQLMQKKTSLSIVCDQKGKLTYTKDLCEAAVLLMEEKGIFHFANAEVTSWYDIVNFVFQYVKKNEEVICEKILPIFTCEYPTDAIRPLYSVLDTTKYERIICKKPRSWKEALQEYLEEIYTYA